MIFLYVHTSNAYQHAKSTKNNFAQFFAWNNVFKLAIYFCHPKDVRKEKCFGALQMAPFETFMWDSNPAYVCRNPLSQTNDESYYIVSRSEAVPTPVTGVSDPKIFAELKNNDPDIDNV